MNATYDLEKLAIDVINFGITEANTEKLMNLSDEENERLRKYMDNLSFGEEDADLSVI